MRLAAIDIGTNSLHMIVVRVRPDLSFEVVDREKEMVRLGAGGLDGRALTREATNAALQVLSKFRRLAESHGVDETVAVATSAVREAENGGEFLDAITSRTGIRPRVISGTEEARLIHMAAAYGVGGPGEVAVVVDIGGGSVEITRGAGDRLETGRSFKLGVIRLTERFVKTDPISPRDERRLVRHVRTEIDEYLDQLSKAKFDRLIGTSGTILSLGAVATAGQGHPPDASLRNRRVSAKQLHRIRKTLVALDIEKRLRVPGLDPRRADIAVAGAVLIDTIVRRLGANELTLCDLSLREGLVLDYIARHRQQIAQVDRYPDVRRRSVIELAERCNYWPEHAQQVARLATALFDQTRSLHGLTDREREWLEFAALLHDVGVHISYERHHRHSYYLVKNGDLRGFEPDEIETIALIARYHRQATPKRRHEGFRDLSRTRRQVVSALAAMLRLAEGLDRSHAQTVTAIELLNRGKETLLRLRTSGDVELEVWAGARHAAPFERLIAKPLHIAAVQKDSASKQPHATDRRAEASPRGRAHRSQAREAREAREPMKIVHPMRDGDRGGKEAAPAQSAGVSAGPRRLSR
jgi:exopolyphosphatase/guanosine-5'-triphosphate,3'-diphosphate pyrophosphatase